MKIRIQDSHFRIRVTRAELDKLCAGNEIVMTTNFNSGTLLTKVIPISGMASAELIKSHLVFSIPKDKIVSLASNNDEGFEEMISIKDKGQTTVLFQKDYVCVGRDEKENIGLFPNPKIADGTC